MGEIVAALKTSLNLPRFMGALSEPSGAFYFPSHQGFLINSTFYRGIWGI